MKRSSALLKATLADRKQVVEMLPTCLSLYIREPKEKIAWGGDSWSLTKDSVISVVLERANAPTLRYNLQIKNDCILLIAENSHA